MATLQQMTTEYLELLLVTNPQVLVNGQPSPTNLQGQSFPLTLVVNGQLTTPITRQQILNELANRIATDAQNPTNPATSYAGPVVAVQSFGTQVNSNGTLSPVGAVSPVVADLGPTPAQNNAITNLGGSMVVPVEGVQYVI